MLIILTILISGTYSQGINPGQTAGINNTRPSSISSSSISPSSISSSSYTSTSLSTYTPAPIPTMKINQSIYSVTTKPSMMSNYNQVFSLTPSPSIIPMYQSMTSLSSPSNSPSSSPSIFPSSSPSIFPSSFPDISPDISPSILPSISYSTTINNSTTYTQSYYRSPSDISINLSTAPQNTNNTTNYIIGGSIAGGIIFLIIISNLVCTKKIDALTNSGKEVFPKVPRNITNHNPISTFIPPANQIPIEWKKYSDGNDIWYISSQGDSTWILPKGAKIINP